jgi:hypothetical protein
MKRDLRSVERQLEQAGALQPDFAFVSAFGLDGTLQAVYPVTPTSLRRNFASRDWYKGVAREWKPYVSEVYQTSIPPHQQVVAIATMQGDREKILNSKFDGYLSKPVNARALVEELERLLGKREDRNAPPNPSHESQASGKRRAAGSGE